MQLHNIYITLYYNYNYNCLTIILHYITIIILQMSYYYTADTRMNNQSKQFTQYQANSNAIQ